MLSIFDTLRGISMSSVALRLFLTLVCGGIIGIEREFRRRPAGFRTHILICMGASLTTLVSQYLTLYMGYQTDMTRIGAQVIAGIGFIGAGTIIVTRRKQVKGLTTAAGLWASAIVGLSLGAGFYEAAIITTVLIFVTETFFAKLERRILKHSPEINLYIEYKTKGCLENVLKLFRSMGINILNLEITRSPESESLSCCAIFTLRLNGKCRVDELLSLLAETDGVLATEEL